MTSIERIKKELEKQILLLSKLSERKNRLTRTKIKIAHEIAQLSYVLIMYENSVNHQSQSSPSGARASQGRILEQT